MTTVDYRGDVNTIQRVYKGVVSQRRRLGWWLVAVAAISAVLVVVTRQGLLGADRSILLVLGAFAMAMVCEYVDSALGMGYGTTLTPVLLLLGYAPLDVVPVVLFSELLTGVGATLLHHHDGNVDFLKDPVARRTSILLGLLSAVGTVAAVFVAISVPQKLLKWLIAAIVLSMGVIILATLGRRIRYRAGNIVVLGTLAAFNKGLSGGGYGPLVTSGQVISGVGAKAAVAITSLAESLTCLIGLLAYALIGKELGRAHV